MGFLILGLFIASTTVYFLFVFIQSYEKKCFFIRWALFLPVSVIFTLSVGAIFGIIFIGIIPLREIVFLPLSWTICPIVFFVVLNKTMPKGQRITTNILVGMWLLLGILDLFRLITSELFPETFEPYENTDSPWMVLLIARLIQTIVMLYLLFRYNNKQKKTEAVKAVVSE
jgi:hypothetical protein